MNIKLAKDYPFTMAEKNIELMGKLNEVKQKLKEPEDIIKGDGIRALNTSKSHKKGVLSDVTPPKESE